MKRVIGMDLGDKYHVCVVLDESGEELEAKANEALSKVLSSELTFAEAVTKYSDDQMTASNGGEIPSMMATDQSGLHVFWR